jgi:cholesterol transport system auxiliary component
MILSAARRLAPAVAALALGGCISLFPQQPPAQLYTFGEGGQAVTPSQARFVVLSEPITFDRMASTDRILTVSGNEVAYIKGGRWASPAPLLFHSAMQRAFDAAGGPRLIDAGEAGPIDTLLKVTVLRFEARYDHGPTAAPTVVVRVSATLNKNRDRSFISQKVFEASVPATENRIGSITQAFDQASSQVLGEMAAWVGQTGA